MARKREIAAETKRRTRKIVTPTAFSVQVDNYIANCVERNLKRNTIDSYIFYLSYFKSHLASNNHSLLVDDITQADIKGFFNFMRNAKDNKQATINSAIASIRPFFTYLVSEEIIVESPMAKISKGKVDKNPIIPFTENELSRLLKQPDKSTFTGLRDYSLMLVLISTGIRISECLNLRLNDVDFKNNRIIVSESKNRRPRIVGLASKLKPELQKFIRLCMNDCHPTDYLFQGQDGGQLRQRSIQQNIKDYGKQAKIDETKRVSPHTFRHTYSINFLKNGGSTASLREQLGHLTITTVEKYLYWSTDEKLEQFQKYNPLDNMTLKI
jgi:integrase/recombinase XerD